jgi:hypothetical protein
MIFKIAPNHELDWSTDFKDTYPASKVSLNMTHGGTFYVLWERNRRVYVNLMNMSGQILWAEDISPESGSCQICEGAAKMMAGGFFTPQNRCAILRGPRIASLDVPE